MLYNYKIKINEKIFQNQKIIPQDKYFYLSNKLSHSGITPTNFNPIELMNFKNIKEI